MIRKVLLVLAIAAALMVVVGCNTVRGVGRDIEWVGEKGSEIVN